MDVMRITVVDSKGTVSFIAHTSAVVALTAACSTDPDSLEELLDATRKYDRGLFHLVRNGLAVFDEHNMPSDTRMIHEQLATLAPRDTPVFRVVDDITRDVSLQPVRAGAVLFNLLKKRIVQISNTDETLARSGQVNFHNGKFLSIRVFDYELPSHWTIVP